MMTNKLYVQYGAGNEAIEDWVNFDASPTLRIQKTPLIGPLLRAKLNCIFDDDIRYGDIVKGLPIKANSVDGLFCSHVIEHLSYQDCQTALKNSFSYLKRGGIFRLIVPDLFFYIDKYQKAKFQDNDKARMAACEFCKGTCIGLKESRTTFMSRLIDAFRNSRHLWMWDYQGLKVELKKNGFVDIKRFEQGYSEDNMFLKPERDHQFGDQNERYGLAIECRKPK